MNDNARWQRKLGRIRLGAEPVQTQLACYRRATWVITGVTLAIALFILTLFTGFGQPKIGLWTIGIIFAPIIGLAWLDHWRLSRVVRAYLAAHQEKPGNTNSSS